jgi:hypothetical protein
MTQKPASAKQVADLTHSEAMRRNISLSKHVGVITLRKEEL